MGCRFVLGPVSAQRLGLPGSDLSSADTQSDDKARAQVDRATTDDPSLADLNSQFYRMRFGRDLRLSEVCVHAGTVDRDDHLLLRRAFPAPISAGCADGLRRCSACDHRYLWAAGAAGAVVLKACAATVGVHW